MNRRSFFRTLATATAGFTILPAATTYERIWKAVAVVKPVRYVPNPEWFTAPYEWRFMMHRDAISGCHTMSCDIVPVNTPHQQDTIMELMPVRTRHDKSHIPPYIEG